MFDKKDVEVASDIDSRCAGWRRPPGMKMKRTESLNPLVVAVRAMLQQMSSGLLHRPSKHWENTVRGTTRAVEKRRARNKMARRSRRTNRMYA